MHSIEEKAIQTYQKNLNYFFQNHQNIYKKVNVLSLAIESGQYQERYSLEYINGYFDIKELSNNHYIYGENSNEISKKVAQKVTFKKNDNVIESFYNISLTKEKAEYYHNTVGVLSGALYASASLIHYTTNIAPKNKSTFKNIEKYIYFGVGLAQHLKLIQQKLHSSKILIVEKDIEIFRLSMFVTDYEEIFKNVQIFYSLSENEFEFKQTFNRFFLAGYNHNHYLKYTIFSDSYLQYIKQIQNFIVTNDALAYPYSMLLINLLKTPEYLVERYKYLNINKSYTNNIFSQKPVMLVAAGPSLKHNIKWLQENQNKFTLVSVLAAIPTLNKHNIKPDMIVNIDSNQIIMKFFKDIDRDKYLKDVKFIFSSMVNKKVSNVVSKEEQYIFEATTNYKINFGKFVAPSVGETTYGLLLTFGAREIYLLGLDLALDPETKQKYANNEYEPSNLKIDESQENIYNTQLSTTLTNVKGNFIEQVPSIPLFINSIFAFAEITKQKKKKQQKVYNLSNGAFLEDTIPLKTDQINLEKFEELDKNTTYFKSMLGDFLNSISEDLPSTDDIENFSVQINEAIRLYETIKIYKERKKFSNSKEYMLHLAKLINELIAVDKDIKRDINIVMHYYIQLITPYIFDFFNTKEVKNHKKHIKQIHKILTSQLEKMLVSYIDTLKIYKLFAEKEVKKVQLTQ